MIEAGPHLDHRISPKNYTVAVVLCALTGILGFHFFYIQRVAFGLFDLGLSILAVYLIVTGHIVAGLLVLAIDFIHSMVMTFRLLTGQEVDGNGRRIIYPGQNIDGNPS